MCMCCIQTTRFPFDNSIRIFSTPSCRMNESMYSVRWKTRGVIVMKNGVVRSCSTAILEHCCCSIGRRTTSSGAQVSAISERKRHYFSHGADSNYRRRYFFSTDTASTSSNAGAGYPDESGLASSMFLGGHARTHKELESLWRKRKSEREQPSSIGDKTDDTNLVWNDHFSQHDQTLMMEQATPSVARTTDGYAWSNLYDEAHEMMMAAFVSYPMTFILREAKAGRLLQSDNILEKLQAAHNGDLAVSIGPHDFLDIVRDNFDYITANYPLGDEHFGWYSVFKLYLQMTQRMEHPDDISIMEFDDQQEEKRLVYGIGINKPLKRITVFFRGTYAEQTRDWARNLQVHLMKVPLPDALVASVGLLDDDNNNDQNSTMTNLYVHRGIYEYLLHNSERGPEYPRERYEEILGNLLTCLEKYPDYKIFVTGHSLGGGLAVLLAFFLACNDRIPKPVTTVSLGSLLVGDHTFQATFEQLERLGWLRHLRITNEHDPIPNLPPFQWYQPVGMHLILRHGGQGFDIRHASKKEKEEERILLPGGQGVGPTLQRLWQSYQAAGNSLDKFMEWHMIPAYLRRLERNKYELQELSLNECYRSPDFVGSNFETKL